jgi:hypothetical protein
MESIAIESTPSNVPSARWLTWNRCAWFVTATFALGLLLGVWWPLWLMPPRLSDTAPIYGGLSQLWLVVLAICAVFRPANAGRKRMLKTLAMTWPLSALLAFFLSAVIWSKGTDFILAMAGNNDIWWLIYSYYFLIWVLLVILPLAAFRKWFQQGVDELPKLRELFPYLAAGAMITIVYALSVVGNVALVGGGILTDPLRCDPPVILQGQISYTCHQNGMLDYRADYTLSGVAGSPVGQMRNKAIQEK